jgi:hypothetical protein
MPEYFDIPMFLEREDVFRALPAESLLAPSQNLRLHNYKVRLGWFASITESQTRPSILMTTEPASFENSLPWPDLRQLHAYWRSKYLNGRLPSRDAIEPGPVHKLLPRIYLVDVLRGPGSKSLGFRFRLAGSEHFEINEIELTGLTIEQAFAPDKVDAVRAAYSEVVTSCRPLLTRKMASCVEDRNHIYFDRLLLPLASDGATVDMILGYVHRLDLAA